MEREHGQQLGLALAQHERPAGEPERRARGAERADHQHVPRRAALARVRPPRRSSAPSPTGSTTARVPSGSIVWPSRASRSTHAPSQPRGVAASTRPSAATQRARAAPGRREPVDVAGDELGVAAPALARELQLRRARDGAHQRERVRVRGAERAREIDHAEDRAGHRIVDGRGRARPAVQQPVEVLGREDLHRVVERERRADRVRPDARLAAQRARHEVRAARGLEHPRVPLAPQQHARPRRSTATRCRASVDTESSSPRTIGVIAGERVLGEARGGLSASSTMRRRAIGVDAGRAQRSHERTISSRSTGGVPQPLSTTSCARRSSRACATVSAARSTATQGLCIAELRLACGRIVLPRLVSPPPVGSGARAATGGRPPAAPAP